MGVRPRWRPRIPRRAQGGAAEGGHYAGCKSAAYLSQSAIPLDRPTLIGPNRRKLTLCDPTRPLLGNLNANSTTIQPLSNPAPTIGNLNPFTTARSRQTDDPALDKHPRLNHPSCRIQERFRLNRPTFVILPQPVVPNLLEDEVAVEGLVGYGRLLVLRLYICGRLARKELVAEIHPAGP